MNLGLVGYGNMGKEVERQTKLRGHAVAWTADTYDQLTRPGLPAVDCAIEFTAPDQTVRNVEVLAARGTSVVVGTTGWYDALPEVEAIVAKRKIGLLYSPNFSLGVQLFWNIIAHAASLMDAFDDYDVFGHEWHHARKADAPSGTARRTAEIILGHLHRKKTLVTETLARPPRLEELHFTSTRGGSVPGTHTVSFDSPFDTIDITHTARNRSGFAVGAVRAAEWLRGKTGLFTMDDYLRDVLPH